MEKTHRAILDIVVSKPMPFAGIDVREHRDAIKKATEDGHTPITITYLHGEVEYAMGYDIGVCLNGEECSDIEAEKYNEGVYDVKVKGYPNICKAFLWNIGRKNCCLIVDPKCEDDLKFAEGAFNQKRENL